MKPYLIKTPNWELCVRSQNVNKKCETLKQTLNKRGKQLPLSFIAFSPAVQVLTQTDLPNQVITKLDLESPLFFENTVYDFELIFADELEFAIEPHIVHRLLAIETAFYFNQRFKALRGLINFANDIGWFELNLQYQLKNSNQLVSQRIMFQVFPTKMDWDADLAAIYKTIDEVYPLWRFSFAKRTSQQVGRTHTPQTKFPLLWVENYISLKQRLEQGIKLVLNSPHARLLQQTRVTSIHRLKGRLSPSLEAKVANHLSTGQYHHKYQVNTKRLSVNTPENQFIKMVAKTCHQELSKVIHFANFYKTPSTVNQVVSESFFKYLNTLQQPLQLLLQNSFLTEVDDFAGLSNESLVLHQKAGYSEVYKVWQELKLYLGVLGDKANVSMKNIAELYEVWCFLEIKTILENQLGFVCVNSELVNLSPTGLELNLPSSKASAFHLRRPSDELEVTMSHEPSFNKSNSHEEGGIYSWTLKQKPDIFIEIKYKDQVAARWIFDAKYRINTMPEAASAPIDLAPDDAINQMHRYRDALFHIDQNKTEIDQATAKSRPVLAAFVLYPAWVNEDDLKPTQNPYYSGIEQVGIGAFPFLPGRNNSWLVNYFIQHLGLDQKPQLKPNEVVYPTANPDRFSLEEPARIAYTGLKIHRYEDLTLLANMRQIASKDENYVNSFANGTARYYHTPVKTLKNRLIPHHLIFETRFLAIAAPISKQLSSSLSVKFIYKVLKVSQKRRCDLTLEQAGTTSNKNDLYWLFELGEARQIQPALGCTANAGFVIFMTTALELLAGKKTWPQLFADRVYKNSL